MNIKKLNDKLIQLTENTTTRGLQVVVKYDGIEKDAFNIGRLIPENFDEDLITFELRDVLKRT